jgi:hypothetical protein
MTVTGAQSQVFVSVPGSGDVLLNRVLQHGETVRFDQPKLLVALGDGGAVQVRVGGVLQPPGVAGQPQNFLVP